ncbi:GntR family transcriptional regulator [Hyphococcus lacteus]|uniref:GntR family transcriptional regulator n=1 Tax=Hyphococcus lacteus TaxID=3143536 RepID=A0ABV3Z7H5_9PROT
MEAQLANELKNEPLLSEKIRRSLAEEIAAGSLRSGTQLDEQQVALRFGTSRTPAREALRQLAMDGLVVVRPRRGAVVAEMSIERLADMFEMSAEIEALCVRLATLRMRPLERVRLARMHENSASLVEAGDVSSYSSFNLAFHEAIYSATHNNYISEQALALRNRMAGFRRAQMFETQRMQHSFEEHRIIIEAVIRGDGDEAARAMRTHLMNAAGALERFTISQDNDQEIDET